MASLQPADLAYQVLKLEKQLESYQLLHADELAQLRREVTDLKEQVLALAEHSRPPLGDASGQV